MPELRGLLHQAAPPGAVFEIADVAAEVARRRRRRRIVAGGAGGTAAVVAVVAILTLPRPATVQLGSPTAAPAPSVESQAAPSPPGMPSNAPAEDLEAPPAGERQPAGMWLSHEQVAAAGQQVVFAMRGDDSSTYGVSADLERWVDGGWAPVGMAATSLSFWATSGMVHLGSSSDEIPMNGIGLGLDEGFGPLEWIAIPPLEPGWYRFARELGGDLHRGPFEVVAEPPTPPLFAAERTLTAWPEVIAGPAAVRVVPAGGPRPDPAVPLAVQRETAFGFENVAELAITIPAAPVGNAFEGQVELPGLEAGSHRLLVTDEQGTERVGYLAVVDPPGVGQPSAASPADAPAAASEVEPVAANETVAGETPLATEPPVDEPDGYLDCQGVERFGISSGYPADAPGDPDPAAAIEAAVVEYTTVDEIVRLPMDRFSVLVDGHEVIVGVLRQPAAGGWVVDSFQGCSEPRN